MFLSKRLDEFNSRLLNDSNLENCKIFKAYPFEMKPTKLSYTAIATAIGELDADNIELGGEKLCGKYKINAFIYSPYSKNEINSIVAYVINSQLSAYPSAVSVSEISKNDELECLFVKCSFTFYDAFNFGGAENE